MKKLMMLLVAVLVLSPAATAQSIRVDVEGMKKKVAASDADIQNVKKNTKAATWMVRGKVYYDADTDPTKGLRKGMTLTEVSLMFGKPASQKTEEVNGSAYDVQVFSHFDLYIPQGGGEVAFWRQKTYIVRDGLDVAYQAYEKAVGLDPKQVQKAKDGVTAILNQYRQEGDVAFSGGDYVRASGAFARVYDYSAGSLMGAPDTLAAYNAGYLAVLAEKFDIGLKYLEKARELGGDQEGELYFLLFHAYGGLKDSVRMESALKEGVQRYPANSKLIETLIYHYTTTGQDASQLVPLVESALKNDPNNYTFHFGLGLIYDRLKNYDKAAEEFKIASDLSPEDFGSVFNLAITYMRQAEDMLPEINAIPINEQARYEEKVGEFNTYYKKALPFFERAHRLNPEDTSPVELLKSIYYRFRDDSPEMMENFQKYDQMLKN